MYTKHNRILPFFKKKILALRGEGKMDLEVGLWYAVRMNHVITLELIIFFTYIIPLYIYFKLTWIIHQMGEILRQVESGFEITNSTRLFILER